VLLPLLSYISFLFYRPDFSYLSSTDYLNDPTAFQAHYMAEVFSPAYVVILLTGWLSYGLMVVFAWRDVVWLRKQGVVRPFHWAWTFLNSWVYIIGRSVIVYGVARPRGRAPIWVLIAVAVVGFTARRDVKVTAPASGQVKNNDVVTLTIAPSSIPITVG